MAGVNDIITGFEFLAPLDSKTCLVCAVLDRSRYKDIEDIPQELHKDCRCIVFPVTNLSDSANELRPVPCADFNALAKDKYENDHPGKSFEELDNITRKKLFCEAVKSFEAVHGTPAFTRSNSQPVNFALFFKKMSTDAKKKYLGDLRFAIWQKYDLELSDFVNTSKMYEYSAEELLQKYPVEVPEEKSGNDFSVKVSLFFYKKAPANGSQVL